MEEIMKKKAVKFSYPATQCLQCRCMQKSQIANICDHCYAQLQRLQNCCLRCAKPAPKPVNTCGNCLNSRSKIDQVLIPCIYTKPIDKWLKRLKDQRRFENLPICTALMLEKLQGLSNIDFIMPIPIHWTKRLIRGYNQTELLAKSLGKQLDIPVCNHVITRSKKVRSQRGLKKKERIQNQRNSFSIKNRPILYKKHVLLVDDIFTTGATAEQAAIVIKNAGAARITLITVARTPEPKAITI